MGDTPGRNVTLRLVEDEDARDRTARLPALLATGIGRWLKGRGAVDFGRDMSVHPDVEPERRTW